ncbi:hypothetical protein E2C01_076312 [Portunus trituberculatus]|uniref:Uncharacterized protein n=1 Tax=Portunus trituberculatus TaxID=210409 RepID=A0A5B7ICZ2_PORTR|nr:hypothetical protein [Portunus trituberculatus]
MGPVNLPSPYTKSSSPFLKISLRQERRSSHDSLGAHTSTRGTPVARGDASCVERQRSKGLSRSNYSAALTHKSLRSRQATFHYLAPQPRPASVPLFLLLPHTRFSLLAHAGSTGRGRLLQSFIYVLKLT